MIGIRYILVCGACLIAHNILAQTSSHLSSGEWYKFSVASDGVVKIDYNLLRSAGVNPDQIDPRKIRIFGGQNGMLPQANNLPRNQNLTEVAIQVAGESDGQFNSNDYIMFYGQGPDRYEFDPVKQTFQYENNLFTDKNYYFLTIGPETGKRVLQQESIAGNYPLIQQYDDFAYYETERYNILKSGRQWFGEQFDAITEATIRFELPHIVAGSDIGVISHVMAQSTNSSSFQISINNIPVLTQSIAAVPNTTYGIKGVIKADTIKIPETLVGASSRSSQDIKYQFTRGSEGLSVGYLDYFILNLKRNLVLSTDQILVRSSASLGNPVSTFSISGASSNTRVWNVSNPGEVVEQKFSLTGNTLSFSIDTEVLHTFTIFNLDKVKPAIFESKVNNQNLHGLPAPELLIITHSSLLSEAQRLAAHRSSYSGIETVVVTTDQIYNEFSGGKQDVTAIRDFIRSLFVQTEANLKNVLLFGRGSYDYKDRVLGNTNYVPIYESRNSLSPLETYGSDDYYTFLEAEEGAWSESPAITHTMDIGIGRLPVKNLTEARQVVDKLIDYDKMPAGFGAWQNEILFVADDGDFNIHNSQADQLANTIEFLNPGFTTKKFFLDSFEQETRPSGQVSPLANTALDKAIHKGSLIVNFTGHGSERVWMDERILDETWIQGWKNAPYYPLLVTATCEFGRHDDPFQITSGEQTLLQKRSGSIGLVTSARPVNSSTNFTLNRAFYEALFTKTNNQFRDLGTIFKDTKNNSMSGVANRNFSLLGDPSMRLALPEYEIVFDEIKTAQGLSELQGLSHVVIKGHIEKEAVTQTAFTGELTLTLFDEEVNQVTLGDENPPFNYSTRSNQLFRGKASVNQGLFQIEFIMPRNISPSLVSGKFTASAFDPAGKFANGSQINNLIGGLNPDPQPDNTPPVVQLYLGDTTFIPGGIVGPDTKIVARLSDESGINISGNPTGQEIMASINGGEPFSLNNYYTADTNTFKKGGLEYPLKGLSSGKHTLTLSASDTYNNQTTAEVDFVVTEGVQIEIQEFNNYPNPFIESTTLEFTHTRPGEDLEVYLTIYDMIGNSILNQTYEVLASQYRVTLTDWDGKSAAGTKLGQGVYIGKLSVRSLLDGSKNEHFTKLIILN